MLVPGDGSADASRQGLAGHPPPPLFSPHLLRYGRGARSRCSVRGRARLVRCGDVHPHPGPLRVAVSNVTALRPHCHTVFAWEADVVLLGETRLTATGQSVMARLAREAGWQSFWGAPLESRGGGIWDCPPGGTAVLVRQGLPARQVMPPAKEGEDSLATALWHSTRWCHVLVGLGTAATVLHAQAAYGVSGQPALNRAFWQQALDYAARHGAAPQLIGGDFNFPLDDLLQAPPTLQGLLLTRRLVDADSELAATAGRSPLCSYVGVRGGRPTRIDGLLVDTRLAALLRGSQVLPACGIPHHRPVRFDLLAEGAVQSVVKLVRLPRVVIPPLPEEERIPLVQSLLDPLGPRWHAELAAGDVDRLWSTWTWAAEETLLALSVPGLRPGAELPAAPRNYKRGRGTVRLLKRVRLCPRQRRTTGDPVACPEARLQAVQGSLRTVLGWLERPDPRPGAAPRLVMEAWYALQRRLQRVHALGDEYAALQVPDPPDRLPLAAELRGLRTALQGRIRTERQRGDKDRLQAWRDWLDEAWSSKQGAVYKWLKGESFVPPVTFLVRPDGTPTANLREMDSLLQDAWRPINCKYAEAAEPDPAEFLRRYGRHVRCVPMISGPLTGRRLRRALMRMHPSAPGLDGWSLEDLRALPDQLLEWLADLLREVERQGRWPLRLAEGYTALIPKEGPPGPLNTRPLTVLSMVYRLWAGIRLEEAIRWQEAWAHPCAFGFRPARSALDGATVTQVLLELCRLKGWAVAGMSIDYVKCFDLIPQAVVLALALELGMDPGVARALGAMYKQLRRAFKVAGCLGAWWRATNGILQGCPLSVILVNVLTTIWKWEVDALREQVCVATATLPPALVAAEANSESDQASQHSDSAEESELHLRLQAQGPGLAALGASGYADDTQAVAPGTAALQRTAPTTEAWLTLTGQDVRVDKSCSSSQGEGGCRQCFYAASPYRQQTVSASWGWTSQWAAPAARGRCSHDAWKPAAVCCGASRIYPRGQHPGDAAVAPWGGRRPGDGPGPEGPRDHGPAGGMGGDQALLRQGSGLRGPDAGPPHLPGDAHPLRAGAMDDPDCAHPGARASPGAGHLGERPPTPDDRALRARPARGPPAGLATTGGLVVMDCAGPDGAAALGAGAHAAGPAQGAGQPALSCHARAGGPPPGDLWRTGGRGRRGGLSRGTPGSIHRAGGLAPAGLVGRGAVDGGPRARAQHAGHVELPRLRLTARG